MPVICIHANIGLCVFVFFFVSNAPFDIKQDWPLLFGITTSVTHTGANVSSTKQNLLPSGRIPWCTDLLHEPGESRRLSSDYSVAKKAGGRGGDSATREGKRTVWEMLLRRLCRVTRVTSCHCSFSSVGNRSESKKEVGGDLIPSQLFKSNLDY